MTRIYFVLGLLFLLATGSAFAGSLPFEWRLGSPPVPDAARPQLEAMGLAFDRAMSSGAREDWLVAVDLAESALRDYGELKTWSARPGTAVPPASVMRAAEAVQNSGGDAFDVWRREVEAKGEQVKLGMNSPSRVLYFAYKRLAEWEKVEALNLALLTSYVSRGIDAPGCHSSIKRARQELSKQGRVSTLTPVALQPPAPGYIAAPAGSAELRRVAQWLGGSLTWDKAAETGRLKLGSETWAFKLGSRTVASSAGKRMELPATVKMYDGRLRVPLEALKIAGTVKWDSTTRIAWFTPKQG